MKIRRLIPCLALLCPCFAAHGYELNTHSRMTEQAFHKSQLRDRLKDFDLSDADADPFGFIYYDVSGSTVYERPATSFEARKMSNRGDALTIKGWLMRGAIREDDVSQAACNTPFVSECNPQDARDNFIRVYNHFYDPIYNRKLSPSPTVETTFKSVDWALGTDDAFAVEPRPNLSRRNHFTFADARESMFRALTGHDARGNELKPVQGGFADKPEKIRKAYWATTFRALGDVLHLLQDQAQPQHTRNELHPGSIYEKYVESRVLNEPLITGAFEAWLPSPLHYDGYPIPDLSDPVHFFSTRKSDVNVLSRRGLGDYSNRSFFTALKNLYSPLNDYTYPVQNASAYLEEKVPHLSPLYPGTITLLTTDISDALNPAAMERKVPVSAISAFGAFRPLNHTPHVLTRYNYDAMARILIPRAVSYSAGMLNYFFRGKIDFVSENQGGIAGYRIVNLGPEPIEGRFALYYDTKDGKRRQVAASGSYLHPSDSKAWQLRIESLKTSSNNKSPVLTFDGPPSNDPALEPAVPGEYILVFNGNMGQEKAVDGTVGAVAAKKVGVRDGALYIAGTTRSGAPISLKVDRYGTRILNGPNAYGMPISTPATCCTEKQNDFDPISNFHVSSSTETQGLLFADHIKQVSFADDSTYRVIALWIPNGLNYLWNEKTNRLESIPTQSWIAKSGDRDIGDFEFSLHSTLSNHSSAILNYVRTYSDLQGNPRIERGILELPSLYTNAYFGFIEKRGIYISPDGLTLSGFQTTTQQGETAYLDSYDIQITLALAPTATKQRKRTTQPAPKIIRENPPEIFEQNSGDPGSQYRFSMFLDDVTWVSHYRNKPVGYIRNQFVTWRIKEETNHRTYWTTETNGAWGWTPAFEPWQLRCVTEEQPPPPRVGGTGGTTESVGENKWVTTLTATTSGGSLTWTRHFADALTNFYEKRTDRIDMDQHCNHIQTWYVVTGEIHDVEKNTDGVIDPAVIAGKKILFPLTNKGTDAIFTKGLDDLNTPEFRGHSLKDKWFTAAASPAGEVFFATTNKSVLIHEPRTGGIKKVEIPAHVETIGAALWL